MNEVLNKLNLGYDSGEDFIKNLSVVPRVFKGAGKSFVNIISLDDLDRLLTITGLRPPFISLINGKTGLRSSDYNTYYDYAVQCGSPAKIAVENIMNGTTIVVQHIHLLVPAVKAFIVNLSQSLSPISMQTNCYLTPANSQGALPHIDQHHTLLFQLSGRKRWCVWENIDEDANTAMINPKMDPDYPKHIAGTTKPLLDEWVEEGDFILIPRGFIHTPFTGEIHSLHLTMGIIDPTTQNASDLFYRRLKGHELSRDQINDELENIQEFNFIDYLKPAMIL